MRLLWWNAGFEFYVSANNVWLVEIVLPEFITVPSC